MSSLRTVQSSKAGGALCKPVPARRRSRVRRGQGNVGPTPGPSKPAYTHTAPPEGDSRDVMAAEPTSTTPRTVKLPNDPSPISEHSPPRPGCPGPSAREISQKPMSLVGHALAGPPAGRPGFFDPVVKPVALSASLTAAEPHRDSP